VEINGASPSRPLRFLGCSYDSFSSAIWDAAPAYNRQSTPASAVVDDNMGGMGELPF
jgi:hypothetical protein